MSIYFDYLGVAILIEFLPKRGLSDLRQEPAVGGQALECLRITLMFDTVYLTEPSASPNFRQVTPQPPGRYTERRLEQVRTRV